MSNPLDSEPAVKAMLMLPGNRWYSRRAKVREWCQCAICAKSRVEVDVKDLINWLPGASPKLRMALQALEREVCGRCHNKSEYRKCVPFIPEPLKRFFKVKNICWACRNVINGAIERWGLCWASSSDEELDWAMADAALSFLDGHFYLNRFHKRDCCAKPHNRRKL